LIKGFLALAQVVAHQARPFFGLPARTQGSAWLSTRRNPGLPAWFMVSGLTGSTHPLANRLARPGNVDNSLGSAN